MSGNSASNFPAMKKRAFIGGAIAVLVLIGVLAIILVPAREPVSLTFLEYRGSAGAKLKLTNNSKKTVTYFTDQTGTPVLSISKASAGWTNASLEVLSGTLRNLGTGETNQIYLISDPSIFSRPDGSMSVFPFLRAHDLRAGQSAELYVSLEADGPPIRVSTVCCTPPGKLAQQFGRWISPVKSWCGIKSKSSPPGQFEVRCNEPLKISTAPANPEKP
jgi:hypothetical protein